MVFTQTEAITLVCFTQQPFLTEFGIHDIIKKIPLYEKREES